MTYTVHPAGVTCTVHPAGVTCTVHPAGVTCTIHPAGVTCTVHPAGVISVARICSHICALYFALCSAVFFVSCSLFRLLI